MWAILADPIAQVKTPEGLNHLMRQRGVDGVLVPLHVTEVDLRTTIGGLRCIRNLGGFIATVPHKPAMVELCDDVTPRARAIGAVNTIRREANGRLVGDMLDGEGFMRGLRGAGIEPRGMSAYLAGGGGAAMAIAFALAQAGVGRLTLANRTSRRIDELRNRLIEAFRELEVRIGTRNPFGHGLVVNATSLGLTPDDALPMDTDALTSDQIVADIIMQPAMTPLLAAARSKGCRIQPGLPMLTCQLEAMADFMGMHAPAAIAS